MTNPIPEGYGTITPYLILDNVTSFIDFVEVAFDAEVLHLLRRDDGTVYNAEVQIGDSKLMMGEARDEYPAMPTNLYMYVPDVDATYARAIAAGGVSIMEPTDRSNSPAIINRHAPTAMIMN